MQESPVSKRILNQLLCGETLQARDVVIQLKTPEARKALSILREQLQSLPDSISEAYVDDYIKKLFDEKYQVTEITCEPAGPISHDSWKVKSVTANNFRGLTTFGSNAFSYPFDNRSWMVYGENGSGKTSLLGAIVWAMTGQVLLDRAEPGLPQPVQLQVIDSKIYSPLEWPSVVSLPSKEDFDKGYPKATCSVEVELASADSPEKSVKVRRELNADKEDFKSVETFSPENLELCLLMPQRVDNIRFSADSKLSDILIGVSGLESIQRIGDTISSLIQQIKKRGTSYKRKADDATKKAERNERDALLKLTAEIREMVSGELSDLVNPEPLNRIQKLREKVEALANEHFEILHKSIGIKTTPDTDEQRKLIDKVITIKDRVARNGSDTWDTIKTLSSASSSIETISELVLREYFDETTKRVSTFHKWWLKKREDAEMAMKLEAAKHAIEPYDICPLCKKPFEAGHGLLISAIYTSHLKNILL